MIRVVPWLGVGGCLIGWKPEAGDTAGSPTTTPTPTCEPSDFDFCEVYDARTLDVGASLTPSITSDVGMSDLYVFRGYDLQWHAWSDDYLNSVLSFTYGATPLGIAEGFSAIPLEGGVEYAIQIDSACVNADCGGGVSSVYDTFTAEP